MAPPRLYSDEERKVRRRAASRRWHERNPDYKKGWTTDNKPKVRATRHKWLADNPGARKDYVLRYRYGLTLADWDEMLELQGGGCAICSSRTSGSRKSWMTDHDHKTGKVRGLLCVRCNNLLGMVDDSVATLFAAIQYLRASGSAK